jgi:hypothetical protein
VKKTTRSWLLLWLLALAASSLVGITLDELLVEDCGAVESGVRV